MENVERALEIIENGEYSKVETRVIPLYPTQFNITTNDGGIIRLIHENEVWYTKEFVDVILFAPHKDDAFFCCRYKSNDMLFNRVYNAWKKIGNEYYEKENDENSNKEQTKNEKEEKEAEYEKRIKELEDRIKELGKIIRIFGKLID